MRLFGFGSLFTALITVCVLVFGYFFCFVTVKTGHVGVVDWFGSLEQKTLDPGPHLVHPFKGVRRVSCQTKKNEETSTVATKNGL